METVETKQTWTNEVVGQVVVTQVSNEIVTFRVVAGHFKLTMPITKFMEECTRILTPDELDAKWREMAEKSESSAVVALAARFDWLAEQYEAKLAELRDCARSALAEERERSR